MTTPKEDVVNELHKPARKNFIRRRVIVKGIDDLWQADLAEFQIYSRENKGFKFILIVIDCFSKYVWTRAITDKSGITVAKAMENIFTTGKRTPKHLQTDQGKEFYNKNFGNLMKRYAINHYSTYSTIKASIVERVIRTIKSKLYRTFSLRGTYKYYDILDKITEQYNSTKHRTIGMKPKDVKTEEIEKSLLDTVYSNIKIAGEKKFSTGDIVRIGKQKALFDKSYTPNWSTELFKIIHIKMSNPRVYYLQDMNGQEIKGAFYEQELQKAKHSDVYLVEKILRKKGDKVYVKWLGIDKKFNSWIKKSNVL